MFLELKEVDVWNWYNLALDVISLGIDRPAHRPVPQGAPWSSNFSVTWRYGTSIRACRQPDIEKILQKLNIFAEVNRPLLLINFCLRAWTKYRWTETQSQIFARHFVHIWSQSNSFQVIQNEHHCCLVDFWQAVDDAEHEPGVALRVPRHLHGQRVHEHRQEASCTQGLR